jgi:WD40 repeat protein
MRDQSKWTGVLGNVLGINTLYYDLSPSVMGKMRERIIKMLIEAIQEVEKPLTTEQQPSSSTSIVHVSTIFPPKSSHAPVEVLKGHSYRVTSVCFSPNGKTMVSGSFDKTVRVWDVESGKELRELEGHSNIVTSVCFSPNGKTIVSGSCDKTKFISLFENRIM